MEPTERSSVLPLESPRPLFRVSSGSGRGGWQQRSQRSLSFVQLCIWALTRGQSDQSYANGNQMGRESPVDYRRRREACVFMYVCRARARRSCLAPLLNSDQLAPSPRSFARRAERTLLATNLNDEESTEPGAGVARETQSFQEDISCYRWSLRDRSK